jgi:hypothetical protein
VKPLAAGIFLVTILASLAGAQSKIEIFGGYSAERIAPCGTSDGEQSCGLEAGELNSSRVFNSGWDAAATWNVRASRPVSLGLTADFSGHYSEFGAYSRYNFLFGPTIGIHLPWLTPFGHALFGIARETAPELQVTTFTAADFVLGGGVDANMSRHFAVRVAQIDYEWQKSPTSGISSPQGIRFATGIVVKF